MRVFLQSIVAQLLLTPYIAWRGGQVLPRRGRAVWFGCLSLELLLFFVGFCFYKELPDPWMIRLLYLCNTWYIASIYLAIPLLGCDLLRWTDRRWHWFPRWVSRRDLLLRQLLFGLMLAGDVALMCHAYRQVSEPAVRRLTVEIGKSAAPGRDSLKIVMMSDLHIGEMIGRKQVRKMVELSNAEQPDLVVLVGDIMDYESRFAEKEHVEEELQQLQSRLGTYVVYGNHEYRANRHAKERWLRQVGTLLVDSVAMPDSSFYLIGRDDWVNKRRKPLQQLLEGTDPAKPRIVLDHQPGFLTEEAMNGVDLALHGHTHGGQIWPNTWVLRLVYECAYGYGRKGPTQYYVSSGIGCAGPPYRVGTRSELVVLTVRFQK